MDSNHRAGSTQVRLLAAAFFMAMVGTGYAISTQGVSAEADSGLAIPPIPAVERSQDYFPAQYVNQATVAEEHIQAF